MGLCSVKRGRLGREHEGGSYRWNTPLDTLTAAKWDTSLAEQAKRSIENTGALRAAPVLSSGTW